MGLSDKDKLEARDALAMALELNEPETMIEGLRRLCARRLETAHMSASERDRWQAALTALETVAGEIERANKPKERASDTEGAQAAP